MTDLRSRGITAGDWVRLNALRYPDRLCFIDEGEGTAHTFVETNERVTRLANALLDRGLGKGDRIAILGIDSHRYMETLLASLKIGTCYVPLNFRLAAFEVQNLVRASTAEWIFVSGRYVDLAKSLTSASGAPLNIVSFDGATDGVIGYEELVATGTDTEPGIFIDDEEIMGLAFTSGTTGLPKGVMQSQRMIKTLVLTMMLDYGVGADECRYSAAPMFHISGMAMIMMGVLRGYPNVLHHQFDPSLVLSWLADDRLTGCFMVPTMLSSVLEQPSVGDNQYERLESIIYGAAPMPPSLLRRAMDTFKCDFVQAFGAGTEAGLQTILTPADHRRAAAGEEHLLGSIGRPCTGIDLRLCDDDLVDVPLGEVGEIVTRSDTVMSGYLDNPEATAQAFAGEWFRAGDLARMDGEGFLYLAGRKKDMIIRGGENIYPIEIETVLSEHAAVFEVSVVGVPDEHWGELVAAHLVARPGADVPGDDDLEAFCRQKLAGYKVPAYFVWAEELPKNASGKVLKRELRASAKEGTA